MKNKNDFDELKEFFKKQNIEMPEHLIINAVEHPEDKNAWNIMMQKFYELRDKNK